MDDAQVKLLEQGAKAWNEWRIANLEIDPNLSGANLTGVNLRGADLHGVNLSEADLSGADHLSEADLWWAHLGMADLHGVNLSGADLHGVNLSGADLRGADLTGVNLSTADLSGANLSGADLSGANLTWVNLWRADLSRADLDSSFMASTALGAIDLSAVKGLETVHHLGPSTIGIDTIIFSKGNIPEAFLRGAGVPDGFITYMKSLVVSPIEFYSCFISYSSKEEDFAKRLYADLQREHVRCWFAPEHLKIGSKFRSEIDKAILWYDKLLLVLSENSVNSPWVEKEVETAFEKERRQKRLVLFPIRLDNAVVKTREAWAADIRRTRQIGDFRQWKDHDNYKKAFARLLRDLKAKDKAKSASAS